MPANFLSRFQWPRAEAAALYIHFFSYLFCRYYHHLAVSVQWLSAYVFVLVFIFLDLSTGLRDIQLLGREHRFVHGVSFLTIRMALDSHDRRPAWADVFIDQHSGIILLLLLLWFIVSILLSMCCLIFNNSTWICV